VAKVLLDVLPLSVVGIAIDGGLELPEFLLHFLLGPGIHCSAIPPSGAAIPKAKRRSPQAFSALEDGSLAPAPSLARVFHGGRPLIWKPKL
jgi:hypothetical protein